jgi:hypothetical protein
MTSPHCAPKGICGRILSEMMIAGALALSGFGHNVDKPVVAASDKNARRLIITKKKDIAGSNPEFAGLRVHSWLKFFFLNLAAANSM